jgi:TPR repeat protein
MTSAWMEPPGQDDRAEGQDVAPDDNQLELFETQTRAGTDGVLSPEADLTGGDARHEGGERPADMMAADASTRDSLDVGAADSDSEELRRLEDSIRWLMNESSMRRMPRAASLESVRGLPPVESFDDDSLLLDPDTLLNPDNLFPSQSLRRQNGLLRGAAKMLLMSAVAAPTAYFIATWMQFPGSWAPTDSATISDSATNSVSATMAGLPEERLAAVAPAQMNRPPEAPQTGDNVSANAQPEQMAERGLSRIETSAVAADARAAEPKEAPEPSSDPAPGASVPGGAQSSNPPPATATPPKPARNPEDVALLLQRGRALFEAGDIAAARLFFRRAANAGDAAAAVAMGATYDPDVLAKRFIRGIEADPQEARTWYEKARALGSPEGPRRIEMLAQRQAQ